MSDSSQPKQRTSLGIAAASALAVLVCLFDHLGALGLIGPDEPRYVWIARAMVTTGDWVTPRLYGEPWFEKPILYYWAAATGFVLHIPVEWAARLPSALAALVAALAIGWLGWKHYDEIATEAAPAMLAPLLFSASVAAIGFARAATPDMLFSAAVALAMASAAEVLRRSGALRPMKGASNEPLGDSVPLVLFGAFLGLAVLAKGPAGIVLAVGAIGLWTLATKRWRLALRLAHPLVIGSFCVIALPWYILCAVRNPDFIRIFIFQHNFERYLTPLFQHRQPFWFFIPITLLAVLPWTVVLWPALHRGLEMWREKLWNGSPGFFFACWAFFPVVFFSFSESKLPGYILPAIPALALLLAVALTREVKEEAWSAGRKNLAQVGTGLGLTWVILAVAALAWLKRLTPPMRDDLRNSILASAAIAIIGGIGIAFIGLIRKRVSVLATIALVVIFVEIAGMGILPSLDPYVSARWHAQFLRNDAHPDRIFTYRLPRAWSYGLAFYLGHELPEWNPRDAESALVLTTPKGLEEMTKLGRFRGELEEPYKGILYVPAFPGPH